MRYFPLFMDLVDKPVLVIGGGEVASRKVEALIKAQADVMIVSPELSSFLKTLVSSKKCKWLNEPYDEDKLTLQPFRQVWATTDNRELNHRVYEDARKRNLLVNVVDDQPYCDFITPSMITRGRIQVAISSGGSSPVLIRNLREMIETVLPQNVGLLADFGASKRDDIKQKLPEVDLRRKFWEMFFADARVKESTEYQDLDNYYQEMSRHQVFEADDEHWVVIERDVELLPIKALRYMQQAEVVFYGNHDCQTYLELCRRDAEREQYKNRKELLELLNQYRQKKARIIVLIHPTLRYLHQQCSDGIAPLFLNGRIEK
ncbi:precorrin-2 dehydrogenase/sirohydrochlorin ferrochelatase family protein [Vibrio salinus]|uniref:precorrin-2 dehydrogenase/sirohydrochlorin ferrochelatase family protein n=1 Tax=Vibrio salinus TaxID=2899784 RepID=UPI001E2DE335|nr:siroheme synthase [Vibrio salinus]MCE0492570.1 siroheme synthase [Vibrio salinus]